MKSLFYFLSLLIVLLLSSSIAGVFGTARGTARGTATGMTPNMTFGLFSPPVSDYIFMDTGRGGVRFIDIEKPVRATDGIGKALVSQFRFEPFNPPMPDHIWMDVGKGELRFLHFDRHVSEPDAKLIFIGEGVRGKFCAADQPEDGKTGFVHFHSLKAPMGEKHGHGGQAGKAGYWLRHVAVGDFEMMGTHFQPGIAMNFMPTPPPEC